MTEVHEAVQTSDVESGAINIEKPVDASSASNIVQELLNSYDVIVFSKTTCAFCFELKRTLSARGVAYGVYEVNKSGNAAAVQAHLKSLSGISTVPQMFIKGEFKGDCTTVKTLEYNGELDVMLSPYVSKQFTKSPELSRFSIFYFPEFANKWHVRIGGTLAMIYCILCVGFYNHDATPWCVLALAIDFTLRLIFGGSVSVIGMTAALLSARAEPVYTAGVPKQFATLCCVFFSVFSAGLYLSDYRAGGAAILAVLAAAVGLEGLADWCIGCVVFGIMLYLGLVPKTLYTPYLNFRANRKWAWDYTYAKEDFPVAEKEHFLPPGQSEPTKVDLIRKKRFETEYKLRDFHMIKHIRIDFFAIPMAIAALAYAWKTGGEGISNWDTHVPYQVLAIVAVILSLFFVFLYSLRFAFYPSKVLKEWSHPTFGNFFSTVTITCTLIGLLYLPRKTIGGGALIWIGSIGQMIIAVFKLTSLVYDRLAEDHINASVMMAPVGLFLNAVAFCVYKENGYMTNKGEMNYVSMSRLWFGVAALYAIVLFTITFRKAIHDHHSDNRLRPLLWVWLATSSIAGPSYFATSGFDPAVAKGVFYQSMWAISLMFFTINALGWLRNFYSYVQDLTIWIMPFSLSVFALYTVQYYLIVDSNLFQTLAIITVSIACMSCAVCGLYTAYWIVDMSLFKPRAKWGPLNFLKVTHEAFRFAVPKYGLILQGISTTNVQAIDHFLEKFETLLSMFNEHAKHEDEVLYPRLRRYFPHMNPSIDEEHHEGHHLYHEMVALIKNYKENKGDSIVVTNFIACLRDIYPKWADGLLPHLRNEEETLTVAARKYLPIEHSIEIVKDSFELTPIDEWRRIMPFVIDNLPMPMWKTRYVKCILWALPWRAHEIGLTLYLGLDSVSWNFLAQEIPEIIPRGLPGYHRIY